MKILALCGSLRQESKSLALLQATKILASGRFEFSIFDGLGDLPLFNPDIESCAPESVQRLWRAVENSNAIVIASPEYAHGVTGVMKNTLDWLVGYIPFAYMPVGIFNPSYRSSHADESIKEILSTMAARLIPGACLRIPVTGRTLSANVIADSEEFSEPISAALTHIELFLNEMRNT